MARFARAAVKGSALRGRCACHIHTKHHHCWHRNSGTCDGSSNVFINGLAAQKVGDSVIFGGCQHGGSGVIVDGSDCVFINGKGAARIKDSAQCQNGMCGQIQIIVEGSENVFFG